MTGEPGAGGVAAAGAATLLPAELLSDANAARSEAEHVASLATLAQFIGDVRSTDEVIRLLK